MVSDGPFPMSLRSDPQRWAGCVHGALPEQEYLALVKQAGFTEVKATRTISGGAVEGVQVYSLSVSARKGGAAACCDTTLGAAASEPAAILNLIPKSGEGGCCK